MWERYIHISNVVVVVVVVVVELVVVVVEVVVEVVEVVVVVVEVIIVGRYVHVGNIHPYLKWHHKEFCVSCAVWVGHFYEASYLQRFGTGIPSIILQYILPASNEIISDSVIIIPAAAAAPIIPKK